MNILKKRNTKCKKISSKHIILLGIKHKNQQEKTILFEFLKRSIEEKQKNKKMSIVIDNGSGFIKAGFAGEDGPRSVFPTVVGLPKRSDIMVGSSKSDCLVGNAAAEKRAVLALNNPIERRIIHNWDNMEKIWEHTFVNELRVAPEEHGVLLTLSPFNPQANRERIAQIMFDTFNIPYIYIGNPAVLSLRASGRTNGVVLDSGYGLTSAVPIYENKVLKDSVNKLDFAGDDLTLYMQKLLGEKGLHYTTFKEKEIVNDIKEKLGYVASNFEEELKRAASLEKSYEPPDGDKITVGAEQFKCPEALFQPSLANVEGNGIHEMIFNSVQKSERDVQKELFSNIVLSGGSTLFPDLENRLEKELVKKTNSNFDVKIFAPKYRKYSAWIGGAQLASLPEFESMCISRSEYSESGPSILARFD